MNSISSICGGLSRLYIASSSRAIHVSAIQNSVFMKRQKKMDPEVAKQRETRRRKRLEKEIRQMQKHSKKPKPVDELTLDVKSAKNLNERRRAPTVLAEEQIDERAVAMKDYTRSRNSLMKLDDKWIQSSLELQSKALAELKKINPELYEAAVQADSSKLPIVIRGPALTPSVKNYESPDGDYVDTTRSWT